MAYDSKCFDLAQYFLGCEGDDGDEQQASLAQRIQDAVEGWLGERQEPREPCPTNAELAAAKADEIYSSQLMLKFRDTLSNIVDGLEDEGDRIYFGSTNDADQLREVVTAVEELEWDRILASSQKKPDLYAKIRELNTQNRAQAASILHYQHAKPIVQRMPQTPERDEALQCFDRAEANPTLSEK